MGASINVLAEEGSGHAHKTYKHVKDRGRRLMNRGTNGPVAVGNATQRLDD
jgi:hypothetical protein